MFTDTKWLKNPGVIENVGMCWIVKDVAFKIETGGIVQAIEDKNQSRGEYTKQLPVSNLQTGHYVCKVFFTEGSTPTIITRHLIVK